MNINDIVEHKNKQSHSGYSHDGLYEIVGFCRMKNPTTGEWADAVMYCNIKTDETFVREKSDFEDKFKVRD